MALDNNLEVLPVLNKIDLPSAETDKVCREIEDIIGLDSSNAAMVSAKKSIGIPEVLQQIVDYIPPCVP